MTDMYEMSDLENTINHQ